jgi:[protein-PII] uridylyltransferase
LWNGFKNTLLWSLHHRTDEFLAGGTQFIRAEEQQRGRLLEEVRQLLPASIDHDELEAHFAALPPRYFQIHTSEQIAADLKRTHRFMDLQLSLAQEDHALSPVITWQDEPDRGYSAVNICTWDRAGLFSKITGSLTAAGLNILNAQIFSRSDGVVLDAFYVTDAQTGLPAPKPKREQFERTLQDVLIGEFDLAAHLRRHDPGRPLYQSLDREPIPTRIHFDNQTSETRTVIDLETEDRVGLLYAISVTLADLGVDISLAKISTEKGAAFDSFYVTDIGGGRLLAPERQHFVEGRLRTAIAKLDARG